MVRLKGTQAKKLKFSVNPLLRDKIPPSNKIAFSTGFDPVEYSVDELVEVLQMGYAVSYQFIGGERRTANFLATDIVLVDIDGGQTVKKALADPVVKKYCEFLYTTPSHSPDRHRFRLVFTLPRTITSHKEIRAVATSLSRRLGGDMSATDAARLFYGSSEGQFISIGKRITDKFLKELVQDGSVIPIQDSIASKGRVASARSELQIEPEFNFKTAAGYAVEMQKVTRKLSAYCPFHLDERPSAFLSVSKSGNTYFHCSVCHLTRWMKKTNSPEYDFDSFVKALKSLRKRKNKTQRDGVLDSFLSDDINVKSSAVHISANEFLQLNEIPLGLTFVKSPKGSGKTSYLAESLAKVLFTFGENSLEVIEEGDDPESPAPIYTKTRALLIGHRQSLIRDLSNRLGLNCYLDDPSSKSEKKIRKARYGVCLDSLWKVKDEKYDILIIDEVEQVLAHFLSETLGDGRIRIFEYFKTLIRTTPRVIVLDADLSWNSFTTLSQIKKIKYTKNGARDKNEKINVYINEWVGPKRIINLYSSQNQLIGNLISDAYGGKRIFITSNSKEKIKQIRKAIDEKSSLSGLGALRIFQITSENSREKETQEFIAKIKSQILNYDVVLSSPSLGTGVDITFDGAESKIDVVYGFFENQINSHTEIDQQLARVRHPGDVRIWISPRKYNFEFEFDVVKDDLVRNNLYEHLFADEESSNSNWRLMDDSSLFVNMAAMILADQRASKNNLKENFIDYKKKSGWTVNEPLLDDLEEIEGKDLYRIGKAKLKEEEIERMVSSPPVSKFVYEDIKERLDQNDEEISRAELESFWRTRIELFYQQKITNQLVESDNKARYRDAVYRYIAVTNAGLIKDQIKSRKNDKKPRSLTLSSLKVLRERVLGDILLYEIFNSTPIFKNGEFLPDIEFKSDDLEKFSRFALQMRVFIETQLGIAVRSDVKKKPVEQLGDFLKLVGLKSKSTKTKKLNGKKYYIYKIDPDAYTGIEGVASMRRKFAEPGVSVSEWNFVNKLHGFNEITNHTLPEYIKNNGRRRDNGLIFEDFI